MKKNRRKYKKCCAYCAAIYSAAMPSSRFCSDKHRVYYFNENKCRKEIYEAQLPELIVTVRRFFDKLNNKPDVEQIDLDAAIDVVNEAKIKLEQIKITLNSLKTNEESININNYSTVQEYMSIPKEQRTEAYNGLIL